MTNPTDESYSVPALLRAIEEYKQHGFIAESAANCLVERAAELTASSRQGGDVRSTGWMPIDSCPVGKLVNLRNEDRRRGDDILGCLKDIGYLTEGDWFSTFGHYRAMLKDAFTHWAPYTLPEPPHED